MGESERQLPTRSGERRPKRESAGSYSIHDESRVDRLGPAARPNPAETLLPLHEVSEESGGRRLAARGRRPKVTTDPLARVKVGPLPDNDALTAAGKQAIALEAPHAPAAERLPAQLDDPLSSDVASWPPMPIPEQVRAQPGGPVAGSPLPAEGAALPESGSKRLPSTEAEAASVSLLDEVEEMVGRGDWMAIHARLAADTVEPDAPAAAVLLDALAAHELGQGPQADAAHQQRAIRSVARLLHVPEDSPTALLVAKRLLRRAPRSQQQPPAKLSVVLLLTGLTLGAGAGWLVTRLLF